MWNDLVEWTFWASFVAYGWAMLGLISPKHAGITSRGESVKLWVFSFMLLGIGTSNSEFWKDPPPSWYPSSWVGHEYEVIEVDDISIAGRDRLNVRIYAPTAVTPQDRVATAMDAALHFSTYDGLRPGITRYDLVGVFLEAVPSGSGYVLATADYAVDGCGVSGSGDDCTGLIWTNLQSLNGTNEQLEKVELP